MIKKYEDLLIYAKLSKLMSLDEFSFKHELIFVNEEINCAILEWIEDKETDTQLVVLRMDGKIIVVFRGTKSIASDPREFFSDFKTDIDFKLVTYLCNGTKLCRIHSGFLKAITKVRQRIFSHFNGDEEIIMLGHSLGGALAHICALDAMISLGNLKIRCYTFGCPRVGNKEFKALSEKNFRSLNVIHLNDPIPNFPPTMFRYASLGHELYVGEENPCYIKMLKYHKINSYISVIEELIKKKISELNPKKDLKKSFFRSCLDKVKELLYGN